MPAILLVPLLLSFCVSSAVAASTLGVSGSQFSINGKPTFLLGISYYAALGASDDIVKRDLETMQRDGFNWLRVWADWTAFENDISAVDTNGAPREPFLSRLENLLATCDRRGLIVDVTLSRDKKFNRLATVAAHQRAVETLINRLRSYRNWYLDLGNERNIRDGRFVSMDELRQLRDRAKELDPERLITASHSSDDADFLRELEPYLKKVRIDFISAHRGRYKESPGETEKMTRDCLAKMKELGIVAPIHHQEPFRRGYTDWAPIEEDFYADLRGAIKGGAAGWCFHNGSQRGNSDQEPRRSFDLRKNSLFEQLDRIEQKVAEHLKAYVPAASRQP